MARNDPPDGPPDGSDDGSDDYPGVDETRYANYGGTGSAAYSESYEHLSAPPPPRAWYQNPAGLIGLGILTAAMLALLIYAVVDFTTAEKSRPAVTTVTSTATATQQSPTTQTTMTESPVTTTPAASTVTVQPPVTRPAEPPAPSTASPTVTTVTETAIERRFPRLPNRLNPPPLYETPPG